LEIFSEYLKLEPTDDLYRAAWYVLSQNLVHGDALTMQTHDKQPITFPEWGYFGKGKFQRRDFRFDMLSQSSEWSEKGSLFENSERSDYFSPSKTYPPMSIVELASQKPEAKA
jgi:hypothetical protein